jgi:hypothetical protein
MKRVALAVLLLLAACGGQGSETAARSTTTTSTTLPDPAATACRQAHYDVDARPKEDSALEQITLSRDSRIVAAAREVEKILQDRELDPNAIPPDMDLEYANAVLELARACKAAGYLP